MRSRGPASVALAGAVALASITLGACKNDTPHEQIVVGFVPPTPGAPASSAADPGTAPTVATAYKSFFSDSDAAAKAFTGFAAPVDAGLVYRPAPVDPDLAAIDAVRSRENGCFPLAGVARGSSRSVTITFTILPTGRVSRADVSGTSADEGAFFTCVRGIADSTTFPERPADAGQDVRTIPVTATATAS